MVDPDDVCVLVPTYNEAATIETVVRGFVERGYEHVLVIDGGSEDDTQAIARAAGARVVEQDGSGKGQAVREAIDRHIDRPYVLMLDGDATYRPDEAERMLEPLVEGRAEHVIGNRFADMQPGAMTRLNRLGNAVINRAFATIHGRNLQDILSGYRAFTLESARQLRLSASGFGIETEMAVECVKQGITTRVVDITYEARPEESETNLRPFRDGGKIIFTLYRMAKTNNPLFYFGSVGTVSALVGFALAGWVAYEWFVPPRVSHEVIALVAASGILFGIQLVMFGVLSDLIVTVNREQTRRLEEIATRVGEPERSTGDGTGGAAESEGARGESAREDPPVDG